MNELAYRRLTQLASTEDAQERSVEYLADHLGRFLKRRDKVMILFPDHPATIGNLMKRAVLRCGAEPQFLEGDQRWLTILKTAFVTRSDAIIGPPLTLLGLAKVAKHFSTPLFARNVLVAGYPSKDWMINGIQNGLDCQVYGCYDPGMSAMVAGFSCPYGGVHLRSQRYHARVQDERGRELPDGSIGRVVLSPVCDKDIKFDTGDMARIDRSPCACGCTSPRLTDIDTNHGVEPALSQLGESFLYWGSVLDCKLANTGYGLELELVVFPGEKLPKIPNCAKLVVRPWNPETDEPFPHAYVLKKRLFYEETH